jgi:hypothetical protein
MALNQFKSGWTNGIQWFTNCSLHAATNNLEGVVLDRAFEEVKHAHKPFWIGME